MTPREKAIELVENFADYSINLFDENLNLTPIIAAKKCALIAVNEILNINNIKPYILHKEIIKFYQEVKQEIEKL